MSASTGRRSTRCVDTGTGSPRSGSHPTARSWGRSPREASSSSGTPPPAGHWNGGTPSTRGASASARTMTWSTGAAATRCCAPGTCPWRTRTCSGRPRSATPRCSRTPTSPRTGSRWPTAGSTGTRDGSGSSTPSPAKRRRPRACRCQHGPWASGTWHPQGQRYVATCVTSECAGPAIVLDPATGRVLEKRKLFDGDVWSIAYVDGNRSLLVGGSDVYGRALRTRQPDPRRRRRDPSTPGRALQHHRPQRHPDRGREHRDGPRARRRLRLGALAGDRLQHRDRRPVRGGPEPGASTHSMPLRTARRSRWPGTPARS